MLFPGFTWFLMTLLPLVFLQRLLHREIQSVIYLLTRNLQLTIALFSFLFLPGVFLHELSHYLMAWILGVPTHGFSLIPHTLPDGRLQMGYVETRRTDIVRDSLIGLAPLIAGSLFVSYAAIDRLHLHMLWDVLRNGQLNLFWLGLSLLPQVKDFYLWFYLTFVVAGTMMPSESDRNAWLPLGVWLGTLLGLAIFAGAGEWMLNSLAPLVNNFLNSVALLFGMSGAVCVVLLIPLLLIHRLLVRLMKMDVLYAKIGSRRE